MLMVLDVHVSGFSMPEKKPEICVFCCGKADFCSVQCYTISMLVDVGYGCFVLPCVNIVEITNCAECA